MIMSFNVTFVSNIVKLYWNLMSLQIYFLTR